MVVAVLTVKELEDRNIKRQRRSIVGRLCIPRNRHLGNILLMQDYFADNPIYPPHLFRRRYRMRRSLFVKIVQACEANSRFFTQRRGAWSSKRGTWTWSSSTTMSVAVWSQLETLTAYKHYFRHTGRLKTQTPTISFRRISLSITGKGMAKGIEHHWQRHLSILHSFYLIHVWLISLLYLEQLLYWIISFIRWLE